MGLKSFSYKQETRDMERLLYVLRRAPQGLAQFHPHMAFSLCSYIPVVSYSLLKEHQSCWVRVPSL